MFNGAAISWRASRTTLIVLNAAEAEQYSLSSATQKSHLSAHDVYRARIPSNQPDYHVLGLPSSCRLVKGKQIPQSQ